MAATPAISIAFLFFLFCGLNSQTAPSVGVAVFSFPSNTGTSENVTGRITFTTTELLTKVEINLEGFSKTGARAIHIHEFGDLRGYLKNSGANVMGAKSSGSHWDPLKTGIHGCETDKTDFHMGDLGNWIVSSDGKIQQSKVVNYLNLTGPNSIIGRVVAIDEGEDDCRTNGNSGSPVAAAVIGIANVAGNTANVISSGTKGVCVLQGTSNKPASIGSVGLVLFEELPGPQISIVARALTGDKIEHGFHVHLYGDLSAPDATSAGPHFNPDTQVHGLPTLNPSRHLGDLGSIRSYDTKGNGWYNFTISDYIPASSLKMQNFIGRAVVIHSSMDHGNEVTCPGSDASGASGIRFFTCVIGFYNPIDTTKSGNELEIPVLPSNVKVNNTWFNINCSDTPTEAPTFDVDIQSKGSSVSCTLLISFLVLLISYVIFLE